jgi:hypothetical protein
MDYLTKKHALTRTEESDGQAASPRWHAVEAEEVVGRLFRYCLMFGIGHLDLNWGGFKCGIGVHIQSRRAQSLELMNIRTISLGI